MGRWNLDSSPERFIGQAPYSLNWSDDDDDNGGVLFGWEAGCNIY